MKKYPKRIIIKITDEHYDLYDRYAVITESENFFISIFDRIGYEDIIDLINNYTMNVIDKNNWKLQSFSYLYYGDYDHYLRKYAFERIIPKYEKITEFTDDGKDFFEKFVEYLI